MARDHSRTPRGGFGGGDLGDDEVSNLVYQREQARMDKDFSMADNLREQLSSMGVTLFDKTGTWKAADGRSGRIPTFKQLTEGPEPGLQAQVMSGPVDEDVARIKHLVMMREQARASKDFAQSDRLRDELKGMGVDLMDKEKMWKSNNGLSGVIVGYRGDAGPTDHEINILVVQREKARQNNDYAMSDMIRDELRSLGVELKDKQKIWRTAEGRTGQIPSWTVIQGGVPSGPVVPTVGGPGFAAFPTVPGIPVVQAGGGDIRSQVVQAALQAASNPVTAARTLQLLQGAMAGGPMPPPLPPMGGCGCGGPRVHMAPPAPPRPSMSSHHHGGGGGGGGGRNGAQDPEAREALSVAHQVQAQNRGPTDAEIDMIISIREKVRQKKDFSSADELRGALSRLGIELMEKEKRWTSSDGRHGHIPLWSNLHLS